MAQSTFPSQNVQLLLGPLLEVESVEKVNTVVGSTFPSQDVKEPRVRTIFEGSDVVLRGRRKGCGTLPKVRKTYGF